MAHTKPKPTNVQLLGGGSAVPFKPQTHYAMSMPNIHSKNTLKSPTQVAWEQMEATKAKLIEDTKVRLKQIREEVRRLEAEECQLEDLLRKA